MTHITINGQLVTWSGDKATLLLHYLRLSEHITSPKDGCSGEGVCGACTVEVNGRPRLACRTKMADLDGAVVVTTEGLPDALRRLLGSMFAEKGAVQCGFCSPGFIMRVRHLFDTGRRPSRDELIRLIKPNICRCTGYVKILDAIEAALDAWPLHHSQETDMPEDRQYGGSGSEPDIIRPATGSILSGLDTAWQHNDHSTRTNDVHSLPDEEDAGGISCGGLIHDASIGSRYPKYQAIETALGSRPFVDDMHVDGMLYGVLRFSDHPRAGVLAIDVSEAAALPGVVRVVMASDVPGDRHIGLIYKDWPLMVAVGETTNCIGDVLAVVVADSEATARAAAALICVDYELMEPLTDMHAAALPNSSQVHSGRSNLLENCSIRFGDVEKAFEEAAFVSSGIYETQRVEHAFLETEAAIACPESEGIVLYSQGQGVYVDRRQVASILGLSEDKIRVIQVQNGGGFGGKEDLTVQGHAALCAWLLQRPVKVRLTREESLCMHPKRHPVWMDISLACDAKGRFTALRLKATGDTGAYASVGTKVMERVVGHATGGYTVPAVDVEAITVYTNNIPSGAMRGFGVPQITFAIEGCIDDICRQGGFDRWQIRYDNALQDGATTATGQRLQGVGLRKTLLAVQDAFVNARHAGIACGIKNTGVGNGMTDESEVIIEIVATNKIRIHHGWTEMGQGVHTIAIQTLAAETGIDPSCMEVVVDTGAGIPTGMTTSSRATALVGNAIIDAAKRLHDDMMKADPTLGKQSKASAAKPGRHVPEILTGRKYKGKYVCDWTCKPGDKADDPEIHFAYGYATQVVVLDDAGAVSKVIAAHDAGRIMNRMLFEGQIEGAVHMGLGYALTEDLPMKNGRLISKKFRDLGILRADQMPVIEVIGVEEPDRYGPYGAKGIGEIGMVPTAAAVANAFTAYDGVQRVRLPVNKVKSLKVKSQKSKVRRQ